ncbi:unnamed protein product [Caenorhabditis bovis]|uniref:NTR domain-containing protein n=1 Tax=Caenorhabditis bovis TaxID=2654633 RepID=A0A8S1E201_9PELO|nr:unnamed protein product [Caenorhabditis bovis]
MVSYKVEHIKLIKAPKDIKELPNILNSATEESACGQTHFKIGKKYIFAGSSLSNSSIFISFCDWRVPLKYYDIKTLELNADWDKFVKSVGECAKKSNV